MSVVSPVEVDVEVEGRIGRDVETDGSLSVDPPVPESVVVEVSVVVPDVLPEELAGCDEEGVSVDVPVSEVSVSVAEDVAVFLLPEEPEEPEDPPYQLFFRIPFAAI